MRSEIAPALDALSGILAAEEDELRRLLAHLEDEQQALLAGDVARVADCLGKQDTASRGLASLERRRHAVTQELAVHLGPASEPVTLGGLLGRLPEAAPALAARRNDLGRLVERLLAVNRRNGFIATCSLGLVEKLLGHLVGSLASEPAPTYAATGRTRGPDRSLELVDRRA